MYRFGGTDFPFRPNTGNDFAAFLLGSVVRADFNIPLANWLPRWWGHSFYFQDDWSVSPKLTLNLGVRWYYESPFSTKYGQQSQFDPSAVDPVSGRQGAIVHTGGLLGKRDLNNFQPRVGLAYKINDKMVFRGGFGAHHGGSVHRRAVSELRGVLHQRDDCRGPRATRARRSLSVRVLGRSNYNILPDGTSPFVGSNYANRNATWYDPNLRNPYTMNWNATYQYQFAQQLGHGNELPGFGRRWPAEFLEHQRHSPGHLDATGGARPDLPGSAVVPAIHAVRRINHFSNYGHSTFHSGTVKVGKALLARPDDDFVLYLVEGHQRRR